MRYFRTAIDDVYEQSRATLDTAWGHVSPITCIEPAASAPRDPQGGIVLAVNDEFCEYSVAVDLLPQLLEAGVVQEIAEAEYRAAVDSPSPVI